MKAFLGTAFVALSLLSLLQKQRPPQTPTQTVVSVPAPAPTPTTPVNIWEKAAVGRVSVKSTVAKRIVAAARAKELKELWDEFSEMSFPRGYTDRER